MRLPIDVRDIYKTGSRLAKERDREVRLLVVVESDAPPALLDVIEEHLRPHAPAGVTDVRMADEVAALSAADLALVDGAILLVGSAGGDAAAAVAALRRASVRVAAAVLDDDTAVGPGRVSARLGVADGDVMRGTDGVKLLADGVGPWLVDAVGDQRLSLGNAYPIFRRAVADDVVRTTAWQNALIGLVVIVPGADLPLMTANQAKMILQIAAAYGERLGSGRIKEIAAVVGGGFVFREVARQGLALIPGFGWAVKGGIAFAGTVAMGRAAIAWFEEGADLATVTERLKEVASGTGERVTEVVEGARAGLERMKPALPVGHRPTVAGESEGGSGPDA